MNRLSSIIFLISCALCEAQNGPAGIGSTDGTSPLKLWLDGNTGTYQDFSGTQSTQDSSRLRLWKDRSGNYNNAFAYFDSTRPTHILENQLFNGQGALRFTRYKGNDNKRNFLATETFAKTNDITMYCVFHPYLRGGGTNFTPFKSKFINLHFWYYGAGIVDAGVIAPYNDISMALCDSSLAAGAGDSTTLTDYTVKTPLAINNTHFGIVQKEAWSGMMSVAKDGEPMVSYQAGKQPITHSLRYYIGATSDLNTPWDNTFFEGYIASVIVYNKILSQVEKVILENYLSTRYGIAMSQNDLFKMDQAQYGNYDYDMAAIGRGNDGSSQPSAKGEGIITIAEPTDLGAGEYLFWAHNGQATAFESTDVPEGIKYRLKRSWRVSEVGEVGSVDLIVDAKDFVSVENKELVLLIDANNDDKFQDQTIGNGMKVYTQTLANGKYMFRGVNLRDAQRFTFGVLAPTCLENCDATFSPNGDGQSDTYYIEVTGKTLIYDKYGKMVRELNAPTYWDGTTTNGDLAEPGIYFIVNGSSTQKTITLIR